MYISVYYEGPLQISVIALNDIPSGNKVYLIWFLIIIIHKITGAESVKNMLVKTVGSNDAQQYSRKWWLPFFKMAAISSIKITFLTFHTICPVYTEHNVRPIVLDIVCLLYCGENIKCGIFFKMSLSSSVTWRSWWLYGWFSTFFCWSSIWLQDQGPVFSYKLQYMVGLGLVEINLHQSEAYNIS